MQVDIGSGDVIVPPPKEVQYPVLLNSPSARLRAYPREAVVAEKLEALVKLGMANTRMQDLYDLEGKPNLPPQGKVRSKAFAVKRLVGQFM